MPSLPPDHPERFALADEVHARPPEPVEAPARASHLALLIDTDARERERAHLARLCARHDVAPPPAGVTQFSAMLGAVRLKWERHGEFSGYTFLVAGLERGRPFGETALEALPEGWLQSLPGVTVFAGHARIVPRADLPELTAGDARGAVDTTILAEHFGGHTPVGAQVAEGAGFAFTDFRVHGDGCARFLVVDAGFSPRQAGRMLQRLFEIETYRLMALLALPIARRQSPRILAIERSLAELTDGIARGEGNEEALLHDLTRLAAEVESGLAASQFRFGACRAYAELVRTRIAELREERLPGLQTIAEFMDRRFTPAVATCATVSQRLHDLAERVGQASGLLATRVGIAREKQNQTLLASMDRRAKLQLRLQQTVEGLSVAAIVYYVVGLVGYAAKAAQGAGVAWKADVVTGLAVPVVAVIVFFALRRVKRRLLADTPPAA
jgi:uncharacterized membrane-anchored protein